MTGANAKIKRILVRQNGVEKQVRPAPLYEYSYNFVGKTSAQLTTDGWTIQSGTPTFTTNGIRGSALRLTRDISTYMRTAKKITLEHTVYTTYMGSGLNIAKTATSAKREGLTGSFISPGSVGQYRNHTIYDTATTDNTSEIDGGTYTQKFVIDLVNKTGILTTTNLATISNITLTDTQVNNIKNNTNVFFVTCGDGTGTEGLTSVYIKIE